MRWGIATAMLWVGCSGTAPGDAGRLITIEDVPPVCSHAPYVERVLSATRSPDGQGYCCAPGQPTDDCGFLGGFAWSRCDCGASPETDATLYAPCDVAPTLWTLGTDAHGCVAYHTPRLP